MITKDTYQDKYNSLKTWQVCHMKGAKYLKQFINGIQQGKGIRCNKAFISSIGIFDFKLIETTSI